MFGKNVFPVSYIYPRIVKIRSSPLVFNIVIHMRVISVKSTPLGGIFFSFLYFTEYQFFIWILILILIFDVADYVSTPFNVRVAVAQSVESSAPDRRAWIRGSPGENCHER